MGKLYFAKNINRILLIASQTFANKIYHCLKVRDTREWVLGLEEKRSYLLRIVTVTIALSLLAMKISTALEININSTSSTDTGEGTNDFKNFSEFYQKKLLFVLKLAD